MQATECGPVRSPGVTVPSNPQAPRPSRARPCSIRGVARLAVLAGTVAALLGGNAPARAQDEGEAILRRAFARADAEEESFEPYRASIQGSWRISDGDDELEKELRFWQQFIQWAPDSVEMVQEGEEVVFLRDEEEKEDPEKQEKNASRRKEEQKLSFDFFDSDRRDDYRFRFEGIEERGERSLARYAIKSRKRRREYWDGRIWVDAANGALLEADLEPAKRRFGLKAMNVRAEFVALGAMTLPSRIEMDLEVKVPFIYHKTMRSKMDFSDYGLIAP